MQIAKEQEPARHGGCVAWVWKNDYTIRARYSVIQIANQPRTVA